MKNPITREDLYDFLEKSPHFREICPKHSQLYINDYISEILDEIQCLVRKGKLRLQGNNVNESWCII